MIQLVLMVAAVVVDKVANHQQFVQFVSFVPTINNLCPPGMIRKSPVVKLAARAEKTSSRRRPPSSSAPKVSRVSNDHENHHHPHHKSATIEKTSIIRAQSQQSHQSAFSKLTNHLLQPQIIHVDLAWSMFTEHCAAVVFYWNAWPYQRSNGIVDQLFN